MKESNSRREFLSQSGKMVTAAALFGTSVPLAHAAVAGTLNCEANNTMKITDPHYYLDNVLLETGFDYENGVAVQTRTARQTVGDSGRQNCRPAREQAASGRHAAAL
ncbi:deaminase [Escherichia coli]|uniref:Deaminase n=1 Tax=Escherichia coli TaxID=562 RepID=A0A376TK18_ECOLX|nr:deaminase [Escherichia coli]